MTDIRQNAKIPKRPEKFDRHYWLTHWDGWRWYIAAGGEGSQPRDSFESLLEYVEELEAYTDWLENSGMVKEEMVAQKIPDNPSYAELVKDRQDYENEYRKQCNRHLA